MGDFACAFVGGCMIGVAAGLLLVLTGRIAGISGIVGGSLGSANGDRSWRLLFVAGLVTGISGMTQPIKVIGFLDFAGAWDASLAFVMGGAVLTYFVFFRFVRGNAPRFGGHFKSRLLPGSTRL